MSDGLFLSFVVGGAISAFAGLIVGFILGWKAARNG